MPDCRRKDSSSAGKSPRDRLGSALNSASRDSMPGSRARGSGAGPAAMKTLLRALAMPVQTALKLVQGQSIHTARPRPSLAVPHTGPPGKRRLLGSLRGMCAATSGCFMFHVSPTSLLVGRFTLTNALDGAFAYSEPCSHLTAAKSQSCRWALMKTRTLGLRRHAGTQLPAVYTQMCVCSCVCFPTTAPQAI